MPRAEPLAYIPDRYAAVLFDLDGTLVQSRDPIDGAPETVAALRRHGTAVRFVTNNASRAPAEVAALLRAGRFAADADEVSTSAHAAATLLAQRLPAGSPVLVLGTAALHDEVLAVGLHPVAEAADGPAAVVQGFSPDISWAALAEACLAVRAGALWVACNADVALPSSRGLLPGNGALVAAVRAATGAEPVVAGKPQPALLQFAARAAGGGPALIVGDRLDTDIVGAHNAGLDAVLVLSGVTGAAEALAAPPAARPRYLATDATGLRQPLESLAVGEQDRWQVTLDDDGTLGLRAGRSGAGSGISALRALCATWWSLGVGRPKVRPDDAAARGALADLEL